MLHVAEKVFDDMVNRLLMHLKESKIIDSILKESVRTLPDGTDIKEIKEKIDEIIYLNINQELRMQIQTCEKMQIENFFDNVVNAECFELLQKCDDLADMHFSGHKSTLRKREKGINPDVLKLNTKTKVFWQLVVQ